MKLRDFVFAMLTGIGIGIPVALICMICIGGWNPIVMEFLVWTIASALFGVLLVITFKSERMNPILSTTLNCAGCFLITIGACTIIGYAESFLELLMVVAPVFIAVYVAIVAIGAISMKINEKKANEALSKK
ncbi:MAG: DUF3021 family protein [Ruminococcus sp.]|nr:DUF3021 family protein [Ruminococcus sp.]